jgi:hypothetical protein
MDVKSCPDCRGADCPRYQEQVSRQPTLGLRAFVAEDVPWTPEQRLSWAQAYLHQSLAASDKVADTDVFELHVLPDQVNSSVSHDLTLHAHPGTEYVALLATPSTTPVAPS